MRLIEAWMPLPEMYNEGAKKMNLISRKAALSALAECMRSFAEMTCYGEWIPCKDRLPEEDNSKQYLITDKDGRLAVGNYTSWGWIFAHYVNDPIAWMELPEAYKGGSDESSVNN